MTIATIKRSLEDLRDGVVDPTIKALLAAAAERLVSDVPRLTLGWIADMLRSEGDRAACAGRDVLANWLYDTGRDIQDLWTSYHD